MRRTIAAAILAPLALVLAACGSGSIKRPEPNTVVGNVPTTTTTTTGGGGAGKGDPAAGKTVFKNTGCTACHTLADAGATGTVGPNLDQKMPSYALVVDRVTNGKPGTAMQSFKSQLTAQQIQDVAAYVSSVAGK